MHTITRRGALLSGLALSSCAAFRQPPAQRSWPTPSPWRMLPGTSYRGKQDDCVFVSPQVGWYGNGAGKLFKTTDGGQTWATQLDRPGTYIRALGFVDEQTGFMGNIGPGYFPNVTDPVPLYVTRDGGTSWTPLAAPAGEPMAGVCSIDVLRTPFVNAGALDYQTVVHAVGRVGGPATLLRSEDEGRSWTQQDLTAQSVMGMDVKFLTPQVGFIAGAASTNVQQSNAVILKTADGGRTWRRVFQSTRPWEISWKLSFPSSRVGYATIQNYDPDPANVQRWVAKTTDGGDTWQELPVVQNHAWRAFGIGFVDDNYGWIGGTTTGMETRDGGRTWAPVAMGRASNKVRVLRTPRGVHVHAIGTDLWSLDLPV